MPFRIEGISKVRGIRVGVIDIGSNSIRLVVYDRLSRSPIPIFNEKVLCGLGRNQGRTSRLDPAGVVQALDNLARFTRLLEGMEIDHVDVIATAAVRDADDGHDFIREVSRRCGLEVTVVSGEEEARLSALGVLCGQPGADGVMGDLGGGSLELVGIDAGEIRDQVSLPLGAFRLMDGKGSKSDARATAERLVTGLDWLPQYKGRTFYPVGGAWRSIARLHMSVTNHPIHVIHQYRVDGRDMLELAGLVARQGKASIERLAGVSKRRLETLPPAALVLETVLRSFEPKTVVFSALGLREGHLFDLLPEEERREDPLLHACAAVARRTDRFGHAEVMVDWTRPLFPNETPDQARIRQAASLLSDIAWAEHPDYRAEHAFLRVLRAPLLAIEHAERALLATALFVRYGGEVGSPAMEPAVHMLSEADLDRARLLGLALRLATTLTGGAAALLERTRIDLVDGAVVLTLPEDEEALTGDVVSRRLDAVARMLGRHGRIEIEGRRQILAG